MHRVEFDSGDLIDRCVIALNDRLKVAGVRYVVQKGEQRATDLTGQAGFSAAGSQLRRV